jgi:hypothetical protein
VLGGVRYAAKCFLGWMLKLAFSAAYIATAIHTFTSFPAFSLFLSRRRFHTFADFRFGKLARLAFCGVRASDGICL